MCMCCFSINWFLSFSAKTSPRTVAKTLDFTTYVSSTESMNEDKAKTKIPIVDSKIKTTAMPKEARTTVIVQTSSHRRKTLPETTTVTPITTSTRKMEANVSETTPSSGTTGVLNKLWLTCFSFSFFFCLISSILMQ